MKKGPDFCSQAPLVGIPPSSAHEKTALCLIRAVISVGWQSIFGCFIVYPFVHRRKHHMKQSMSRVAHCIDNGPMEGFWGILKREMYYCQHFNDRTTLIAAITDYINYYNNQRLQRKLNVMTPMEYHNQYIKAA